MSAQRFYVQRFSGYTFPEREDGRDSHHLTTFYVVDCLYNQTPIAIYDNRHRKWGTSLAILQRQAEKECERLNEWWAEEWASG